MSWDVVLFSSRQKITDLADVDEKQLLPVSFSRAFKKYFKNIITDGDHHEIKEDDFTIDYFDDGEPSSTLMLNLYGESAIYPLIDLAIKNNWQIFDTGIGDMIDLGNSSKNGYQNFQAYLNIVLNKPFNSN
ncbi:hypothetical protein J3L18_16955 [Mucilaginibacter gossypii]|uniref:hypothetical protein n=1 Tax=Mucilaginibacter gossypii TaxID=551996 RepID=UPI000DCECD27|nr:MULTISPECIES: hypothetical protein [Mucilaginibacter]QTE34839.1 hypothetical protein J3L18_16955 [Mucilaginibacter gossypii]RAV59645.1 hypothetical protein DIU36_05325 [Mucilaginibacter rubeus]